VLWLTGYDGSNVVKAIFLSLLSLGALVFAAGLVSHLILGPTCVCDIQTSLSRDRLRPLGHYLRAQQVVERLDGLVRKAQEELVSYEEGGEASGERTKAKTSVVESFQVPGSVMVNFGVFTGVGVVLILALMLESIILIGTALALLMGCGLVLTLALIASMKRATPDVLRSTLWIQLGLLFLLTASGAVYYLLVATQKPKYTIGITGPLEAFTAIAAEGGIVGYFTIAILSLGILVSGVTGLVVGARWKAKISRVIAGSEQVNLEPGDG